MKLPIRYLIQAFWWTIIALTVLLLIWIVLHPGIVTFQTLAPTPSNADLQATIQALQTLVPR